MIQEDLRKAQDERFNWLNCTMGHSSKGSMADVSLRISAKDKRYQFSFTFRNAKGEIFGERIELAIYKNRVMFRKADNGYKLTRSGKKTDNRYFQIRVNENTEALKDFVGDYDLKHDDFYELYYIEKANYRPVAIPPKES